MKILVNIFLILILSVVGYLFILKSGFESGYAWLAIPFIVFFALLTFCMLRNFKSNFKNKGSKKGFFASILGFGALQVCGLSAYACSTALGFTVLATILPHSVLNIFQQYSIQIILVSIVFQIYALYQLKCLNFFKKL